MTGNEISRYWLSHKGVVSDYKVEWEAERFLVGGKMAAMMGTHKNGRPILTIKVLPEHSIDLRLNYPDSIIEGYYMNKVHWVSLYLDVEHEEQLVKELIDEAYSLVYFFLSKKLKLEIENQ